MDTLRDDIERDEGNPGKIYKDSLGFLTCGWGHLLREGDPFPDEAAEVLLKHDLAHTVELFAQLPKHYRDALNPARRRVICNMIFNLGLRGVLKFSMMWGAILKGDFNQAADEMLNSRWAQQVGARAQRLAETMRRDSDEIR